MSEPRFREVNASMEAENAYDLSVVRKDVIQNPIGTTATVAHLIKGALGSGVLGGHVAYMYAGWFAGVILNVLLGLYLLISLTILGKNAQLMCKRTATPVMTYAQIGEAAMTLSPFGWAHKMARHFGRIIDAFIMIDLFGSCATYELIIASTIKQLVENSQATAREALVPGYPNIRVYLAAIVIPCIIICLVRNLKWFAKFSAFGNGLIGFAVIMTIYYAIATNPGFKNMVAVQSFSGMIKLIGMIVFSMSCASQCMAIENNMRNPTRFAFALAMGMSGVISAVIIASFFGYVAYTSKCQAPITMNFPMTLGPKLLKVAVALMIYITTAINYYVPFRSAFTYIRPRCNPNKILFWEYVWRAVIILLISIVAIIFPSITDLMGFIGCFCLSNLAFIYPSLIDLLTHWVRPGLGKYNWRLWRNLTFMILGAFIWVCGTIINAGSIANTVKFSMLNYSN